MRPEARVLVVWSCLCSAALAAPRFEDDAAFGGVVARLDTNTDGVVQEDEYLRVDTVERFRAIDGDADRRLTAAELAAWTAVTAPFSAPRGNPAAPGFVSAAPAAPAPAAPAASGPSPVALAAAGLGAAGLGVLLGRQLARRRRRG